MAKILRVPDVLARIGVSRSTLYEWMRTGYFPASVSLGARSIGWRERDVNEWIESRVNRQTVAALRETC